jgi:hypothetical protein
MADEFMESTAGGPKLPALKFGTVGETHTGVVTQVTKLEDRDPAGNLKTYDNGDPRYVFVFSMDTASGPANLWVRGQMIKAIREAADKASVKTLVGAKLSVKYTGDGEKKSAAFNAPKLYAAKVEAPKQDASADMW